MSDDPNDKKDNPPNDPPKDNPPPKTYTAEEYQALLGKVETFKSKANEAETKLNDVTERLTNLEKKNLKESNDYKTLYEQATEKVSQLEDKNKKMSTSVLYNERYRSVMPELQKAGLIPEANRLLERETLEEIDVEATTNGRFICNGVDDYVRKFKELHPYAFKKASMSGVNGGGGKSDNSTPKEWTPQNLFALEKKCREKGDMTPWKKAVEEYQRQQA